jgi:CRISPR/Cas system CMR-associated protein Cmr1 (group 7 of RAMP superfamily)
MKCVEMMLCAGYGFRRRAGIGKFAMNSPASTCDLVKLLYSRRIHVRAWSRTRDVVKETRTTLQTAYFQVACKATHTQQAVVALGPGPKHIWRHNQNKMQEWGID